MCKLKLSIILTSICVLVKCDEILHFAKIEEVFYNVHQYNSNRIGASLCFLYVNF